MSLYPSSYSSLSGLWSDFFSDLNHTSDLLSSYSRSPKWDISEDEKRYIIRVDLPGIDNESLKIDFSQNLLTVQGQRKSEKTVENEKYHLRERTQSGFKRSVYLPNNADENGVNAVYKDGVLVVSIEKLNKSEKRGIPISFE